MSDKITSKADALRAMREANFSAKSSGGGEKLEQPIGAGVHGKAPTTVRVPKRGEVERIAGRVASAAPETKSALIGVATGGNVTRSSGVRFPGGAPSSDGVASDRLPVIGDRYARCEPATLKSGSPSETKSAKPIECPVCAARRKKKAKAQKKWRQGRTKS